MSAGLILNVLNYPFNWLFYINDLKVKLNSFSFTGAGDIVAIMIGNLKGTKILQSIQRGIQVTMVIEVGKKHGPWVNHYSIFFVSVSFFIITAATVGYFIFYSARRLRNARAQSRKQVCHAPFAYSNISTVALTVWFRGYYYTY